MGILSLDSHSQSLNMFIFVVVVGNWLVSAVVLIDFLVYYPNLPRLFVLHSLSLMPSVTMDIRRTPRRPLISSLFHWNDSIHLRLWFLPSFFPLPFIVAFLLVWWVHIFLIDGARRKTSLCSIHLSSCEISLFSSTTKPTFNDSARFISYISGFVLIFSYRILQTTRSLLPKNKDGMLNMRKLLYRMSMMMFQWGCPLRLWCRKAALGGIVTEESSLNHSIR